MENMVKVPGEPGKVRVHQFHHPRVHAHIILLKEDFPPLVPINLAIEQVILSLFD